MKKLFILMIVITIPLLTQANENLLGVKLAPAIQIVGVKAMISKVTPDSEDSNMRDVGILTKIYIRDFITNQNLAGKKFRVAFGNSPFMDEWEQSLEVTADRAGVLEVTVPIGVNLSAKEFVGGQTYRLQTYLSIKCEQEPLFGQTANQLITFEIDPKQLR